MPTSVIELRQYTLHPGQRDRLITLFEREFVETQEAVGMQVLGTFTDLDRPDRFVWWRGFPHLAERAHSLAAFYGGPVWAAHRNEANATMIDSDDVLLLRPLAAGALQSPMSRAPVGTTSAAPGYFAAVVQPIATNDVAAAEHEARAGLSRFLVECGGVPFGMFVSHPGPNDFPRLPVREDVFVFTWLAAFASEGGARAAASAWDRAVPSLAALSRGPVQQLHMQPTPRSAWHL
jgi:hypothetical protein